MQGSGNPTVAVVGLGAIGLVTMKNLAEEGFDVTGFDRNSYLGGLWNYDEGVKISVLETTRSNGSKFRGCFTDFPFPDDAEVFPPAQQVAQYLAAYAEHFNLAPMARLNTSVHAAAYDETLGQWRLQISQNGGPRKTELFDKVVFCMGADQIPNIPKIEGIEKFEGDVIHSIAFKKPSNWAGKKVLVVGFGNTGVDIATELSTNKGNGKVYLSHRHGSVILPRWVNRKPVDHVRTYRKYLLLNFLARYTPKLWENIMDSFIKGLMHKLYDLKPEWGFEPTPSVVANRPIVNDELINCLTEGRVISVKGLSKVIDGQTAELADGTQLKVDSIIFCTGYSLNYSIVGDSDPTRDTAREWVTLPGANNRPLPRLYQNIFSLDHPDSLAFMGSLSFMNPAFLMFDLASMALTQLWKGNSSFPPQEEMSRAVNSHHEWLCSLAAKGSVSPGAVKGVDFSEWVDAVAGTGLREKLGWGLQGWWFWLTDRSFCNILMDGLLSPHVYRVFPGKRKHWDGAREELIKINKELKARNWEP